MITLDKEKMPESIEEDILKFRRDSLEVSKEISDYVKVHYSILFS